MCCFVFERNSTMSVCTQVKPVAMASRKDSLSRLIVHLPESNAAERLVHFAVALARRHNAALSGLSVVDTRSFHELANTSESSIGAAMELRRLRSGVFRRAHVKKVFSSACLGAGLSFDARREDGAPGEILKRLAQAHDLAIVAVPRRRAGDHALTVSDIAKMLRDGFGPLLALRDRLEAPNRVLLVHDGSAASSRTLESFAHARCFRKAQTRLLAVSTTAQAARTLLEQTAGKLRGCFDELELGSVHGRGSQIIPAYARHWQADLVVIGSHAAPRFARFRSGRNALAVLRKTDCAIYAMS
jgi:nucleotide-binding universal stress UspA family protein